jgi:BirA family transcriptional regulator, biotin operon repressor / biotin---[acetyl-CoA-carboxylase] ligase
MEFKIEHHQTLSSTNDRALELAEADAPEGTIVLSDIQTSGRGRKGDHWFSSEGGLWLSIVLRPNVPVQTSLILPLLIGFSIHRAILRFRVRTRIKLPNDVMAGGKKLCGILCENRVKEAKVRHVIAGVGVNVRNDPPPMGISLEQILRDLQEQSPDHSAEDRSPGEQNSQSALDSVPVFSPTISPTIPHPRGLLDIFLEEFEREYSQFKRSQYFFGDGYQ